jgi:hypothetical protein
MPSSQSSNYFYTRRGLSKFRPLLSATENKKSADAIATIEGGRELPASPIESVSIPRELLALAAAIVSEDDDDVRPYQQ